MNTEHMGKLISALRKEKGMTQQALAEKLNITDKAVSKWERGFACPDISLLPQVAEILGVSVEELLSQPASRAHGFCSLRALDRGDVKDLLFLLCRCMSMALAAGCLVFHRMGTLGPSDAVTLLCVAVLLAGIAAFKGKETG